MSDPENPFLAEEKMLNDALRSEALKPNSQRATDSQTICQLQRALKQREDTDLNLRAFIAELESAHQATLNELAAAQAECDCLRERLRIQQGSPSNP